MRLGLLLDEETTFKLLAISEYSETTPFELVVEAIKTMHGAMLYDC